MRRPLQSVHEEECQENRGAPRKRPPPAYVQLSPALQSELRKLQHAAARGSSASAAEWAKILRVADKALALLLPDKGPRPMEISTVYMCQEGEFDEQDTENECETETQQCDHAEDHAECEVKARRDAKMCCIILTALVRKEWRTWNDGPLGVAKGH